jgi:hypothetical protein
MPGFTCVKCDAIAIDCGDITQCYFCGTVDVSSAVRVGERMFSDRRKLKPFKPMPVLTMRERISRLSASARKTFGMTDYKTCECCEEMESAFGVENQIVSVDGETGAEMSHGRFREATLIRKANRKELDQYMEKMTAAILDSNVQSAKCEKLDDYAEQAEEWKSEWKVEGSPIMIDYGEVDKELQTQKYKEFGLLIFGEEAT